MEADLTMQAIAKRAGIAEHVARRVLTKLHDKGVVTRRLYMNSFLLGTLPYVVALTLSAAGQKVREELHQYLLSHSHVGFLAHVSGHYNLFCEVRAKNILALREFLDCLSIRFGSIFADKQVLALTSMNDFPVTATSSERSVSKEYATELVATTRSLGPIEVRILQGLAKRWDDSITSLARALGQPASTVEYHVKKLRSEGVILGSRYFVNLFALRHHFFYHLVSMKSFHPQIRNGLLAYARSESCCNTFRSFIGPWDILFECHYETPQEGLNFVERLLARHGAEISKVETLSVLAYEKGSDCTVS
jgi:DNA-binding Lrp family transcriptional regulator